MPLSPAYRASAFPAPAGAMNSNRQDQYYRHKWNFLTRDDLMAGDVTQTNFILPQPDPSVSSPDTAAASSSVSTTSLTDALYLKQPGDPTAIDINDVNQGQIGDCFLLASICELALYDPNAIMNMIHANADGTETVTLYTNSDGSLVNISTYQSPSATATFRAVSVTVDNTFPAGAVNNVQPPVNGQTEIWAQVLEKAVATLYSAGGADNVGYALLNNGGFTLGATEMLTGLAGWSAIDPTITAGQLTSAVAAGDLVTFATTGAASTALDLVENHEYAFEAITTVNGTPMVQLYNPWGSPANYWVPGSPTVATASTPGALPYQPSLIPLNSLLTYLDTSAGGYGEITTSPPPPTLSNGPAFIVTDTVTGANLDSTGAPYTGPQAGLILQYISPTQDGVNVNTTQRDDYIVTGSGNDGINTSGGGGNNVIDAEGGSNFITAGSGDNTTFLDDRNLTADIWTTITDFHVGDAVTLYGLTPSETYSWWNGLGGAGYQGLTMLMQQPGQPNTSLTLTGYTTADLTNGKISLVYGGQGTANPYLYLQGT